MKIYPVSEDQLSLLKLWALLSLMIVPVPFFILHVARLAAYKEFILVAKEELAFLRSLKHTKTAETAVTGVIRISHRCPHCGGDAIT